MLGWPKTSFRISVRELGKPNKLFGQPHIGCAVTELLRFLLQQQAYSGWYNWGQHWQVEIGEGWPRRPFQREWHELDPHIHNMSQTEYFLWKRDCSLGLFSELDYNKAKVASLWARSVSENVLFDPDHVGPQFSSVTQSRPTLWTLQLQHARLPSPLPTPGAYLNSCSSSQWCHPTISSSGFPLSSCPQSFPAPGAFPRSQLFTSGGQSIGISASASVLPMNIQDWFPLGWTGWISLLSKGLSRIFSSTTIQSPTHSIVWKLLLLPL